MPPTRCGKAGAALEEFLQGQVGEQGGSTGECQGRVSGARKVDEKYQNWLLLASGSLGKMKKSNKISTDLCFYSQRNFLRIPAHPAPALKLVSKYPSCVGLVLCKLLLLCCFSEQVILCMDPYSSCY